MADEHDNAANSSIETAVFKRRWLMLVVVAILNISNAMLWLTFATVANQTSSFFVIETSAVNWFSLVFYITTIPFMFIALWIIDRYGFRSGVLFGTLLNGIGSLIRLLGTSPIITKSAQFPLAMAGQTIASLAQPFAMSLPTKLSEVWFPENQRTLSTAISALSNPVGLMLISIISPIIVVELSDIATVNYITSGIGIATGLLCLLVWESKPPKPPSVGAAKAELIHRENSQSYIKHLQKIIVNKNFMVLTLVAGGQMGLNSALQTMMAQMICPWGYDDSVAGLCSAAMVLGGFVGAAVFSTIAEKTKKLEEVIKYGSAVSVLFLISFILLIRTRDISWLLALLLGFSGFFSIGVYPASLEAGVETIYPIDESFSSGMIVVVGQIEGVILIPVMEVLIRSLSYEDRQYEVCSDETGSTSADYDMTYSGIFLMAFIVVLTCLLIIFFKPKYKRLEAEKEKQLKTDSSLQMHSIQ